VSTITEPTPKLTFEAEAPPAAPPDFALDRQASGQRSAFLPAHTQGKPPVPPAVVLVFRPLEPNKPGRAEAARVRADRRTRRQTAADPVRRCQLAERELADRRERLYAELNRLAAPLVTELVEIQEEFAAAGAA